MRDVDAFASVASAYEVWFSAPLGRFVDGQEQQALARILNGIDHGAVLDIGAGTGHSATWLVGRGHEVTALEPSSAMRREGVRRTAGLPIRWCDARAEHLPFADARFDGALLFTTLEFVQQPVQALREAMRVVRPEGWVAVGLLHALSPWTALYRSRADHGAMPWVAARLAVAAHAGCDLAVITADPGSSSGRNTERSGFQLVCNHVGMRASGSS